MPGSTFLLNIWDLTKRDLIVMGCCGLLSIILGLAGLGVFLFLPLVAALFLVPAIRLIEYGFALRVSATTLATVVSENTATYRVGHGRYSREPADYYLVLQPVVEFETKDGTVRADYGIFRNDRVFLVGEEYEICYSVRNPKIFYFTCRKGELAKRYLATLGFWAGIVGIVCIFFCLGI